MATQVATTQQVLEHHIDALVRGDMPEVLSDYTDESLIVHPGGVEKGRDAIRAYFEPFLAGLLKPGTYELSLDTQHLVGDLAFIVWHAKCQGADIAFACDTFLIRDGKIASQTVAAKIEPHN
jgi:uncharacterized protein (TIGR02246 family)